MQEKLSPHFMDPYEVLERVGLMAYRVALPPELAGVHDIFHVSQLHQYVHDRLALSTLHRYIYGKT